MCHASVKCSIKAQVWDTSSRQALRSSEYTIASVRTTHVEPDHTKICSFKPTKGWVTFGAVCLRMVSFRFLTQKVLVWSWAELIQVNAGEKLFQSMTRGNQNQ